MYSTLGSTISSNACLVEEGMLGIDKGMRIPKSQTVSSNVQTVHVQLHLYLRACRTFCALPVSFSRLVRISYSNFFIDGRTVIPSVVLSRNSSPQGASLAAFQ